MRQLIVATNESEIPALEGLFKQGEINGVEGLRWLSGAEALALEPQLQAVAAIASVESGILDAHGYMLALEGEIEARGGAIVLETPFEGAARTSGGYTIRFAGAEPGSLTTRRLVIAGGLGAQICARAIENFPVTRIPELHFGKGQLLRAARYEGPFQAPHLSAAYSRRARHALSARSGRRRALRPRSRMGRSRRPTSVDPARAASFYETVRRFWPALCLMARYSPTIPAFAPSCTAQAKRRVISSSTTHSAYGIANLVCLFGIESPGPYLFAGDWRRSCGSAYAFSCWRR